MLLGVGETRTGNSNHTGRGRTCVDSGDLLTRWRRPLYQTALHRLRYEQCVLLLTSWRSLQARWCLLVKH